MCKSPVCVLCKPVPSLHLFDFYEIGFRRNDVGMALVYKVHIQGGSNNTTPLPNKYPYINSCKLQLSEISTAATYVGMFIWEWCCVITATL